MMKSDKRERILRGLLNHPPGTLSIYRLAKEAQSSHSWTIDFLYKLEKLKLITKKQKTSNTNRQIAATYITDIIGIYTYWTTLNYSPLIREYNIQKPLQLLTQTSLPYALTTYQAENLIQNYLFPSRIDLYIKKQHINIWHQNLTNHGLVGKGNTRLIIQDDHVFYKRRRKQNFTIVSTPQLIHDLLKEGGVAEEAALMLIRKYHHATLS